MLKERYHPAQYATTVCHVIDDLPSSSFVRRHPNRHRAYRAASHRLGCTRQNIHEFR